MDNVILIDIPKNGYSHMVSNSISYLHEFASKLGVKKCWYENKRGKNQPHYDIKKDMFEKAKEHGAIVVSSKEIVLFLKNHYNN